MTSSPAPALIVQVGDWSATCDGVGLNDCQGVAALFVNNLARNWKSVFDSSDGNVSVAPRPVCPAVPAWAEAGFCWQATAAGGTGPICMVVARHMATLSAFGQVGGDEMTGRFGGPPPGWPTCT
jgi:hypothetical protein